MLRLSIVIPCRQDALHFEGTLASVLQNRPAATEVLVVQPRAYDDPYDLAGEVRFVEGSADATHVDLINRGIEQSKADVIHVLQCGTEVREAWADAAVRHFDVSTIGSVAPTLVYSTGAKQTQTAGLAYGIGGRRKLRHCRTWLRPFQTPVLGPTLTAAFYRRSAVMATGGFCAALGGNFADVDMGMALKERGFRSIHEDGSVVRLLESPAQARLSFRAGRQAERLFWRHASTVGWSRSLAWHAAVVTAELSGNFYRPQICLQLLGRMVAGIESLSAKDKRGHQTPPLGHSDQRHAYVACPISDRSSIRSGDAANRQCDAA